MKITNTEQISGYKITQHMFLVTGNVVHSKHIGRDIIAGIKSIFGGEIGGYSEMLNEARSVAQSRMVHQARLLEADGVINVRFSTSTIAPGVSEILAYGTAVQLAME